MLKQGELTDVLTNYCEIGMYDPKSGSVSEITVMNLFFSEEEASNDLKMFLEYTPVETIDITVDNTINNRGDFKVFIELENSDELFKNVCRILRDCSGLAKIKEWNIKVYKKDEFSVSVDKLEDFVKNKKDKGNK